MRSRVPCLVGLLVAAAAACDPGAEDSQLLDAGSTGGTVGTGGSGGTIPPATGGSAGLPESGFGTPVQQGTGSTSDRYAKVDVVRDGVNYKLIANGWGPGFGSQTVSWQGTSFVVESMTGSQGGNYEPAAYPAMFCGAYSDSVSLACGLPAAIDQISSLRTGWRWQPNGNTGEYNVAYDIWIGNGTTVATQTAFLMVWLRDPPGQQPAGSPRRNGVQVANVPGSWNLWAGDVGGKVCVSYVRPEGQDSLELEFDVLDFWRDALTQSVGASGTTVLSVAVGFEIWNGPINQLATTDFYVAVN
jgi:hypothetical protein